MLRNCFGSGFPRKLYSVANGDLNPIFCRSFTSGKKITKVLAANRGEIAVRICRAAKENNIRSVAIYTKEDALQNHRLLADESYMLSKTQTPVGAYLDIDTIIDIAKKSGADAIHPGYGFLSENSLFSQKCADNGIQFLGPSPKVMALMGDKVEARKVAIANNVPVIPGTETPVSSLAEVEAFVKEYELPIILKAAYGGGGRGMRVVRNVDELPVLFQSAKSEAEQAFGNGALFVEKYLEQTRHVEVQILGDKYGNIVHLFDRDCSVQRRHQKIIEIAPAIGVDEAVRAKIFDMAVKLCKSVGYSSAGTVEFLVDKYGNAYFIEVNSRLQVEHTVSEEVTDIDIVKAQIKIAEGYSLEEIGIKQGDINMNRVSIQARVTTEDSANNFVPDYGVIERYVPPEGPGIRLDGACGYLGATITPFYDSLLTKVIASGKDFEEARVRMIRALKEFKISGVKTNIPFILNVFENQDFKQGKLTTSIIEENPDLLRAKTGDDLENVLRYVADVSFNGPKTTLGTSLPPSDIIPTVPKNSVLSPVKGWKNVLQEEGKEGFLKKLLFHQQVLFTDTSLRDAHQSLLATRMRTRDMKRIAPFITADLAKLFSLECWGGATFDVAMRFLQECPWDRLRELRELIPNIPFQMLLRGANAVGYKNYSDNVVDEFARLAVINGMDIFRIFDALNYLPNIQVAMDSVNKAGGIVEAAISYSGDVSNPGKTKYTLEYYMNLADALIAGGTHILGIKDMAGVLKPKAAEILISELRKEFPDIPIHLHTHDTAGTGVATYMQAIKSGVSIVDVACDSMSGMTSQPSMGAMVSILQNTKYPSEIDLDVVTNYSSYFEQLRTLYAPFECCVTMKSGNADVYQNEIPGGQYTNLQFQAFTLGLGDQFEKVKKTYIVANKLLGDVIKVTPTSKVVGDLAQFMVQNNLSEQDVLNKAENLDFPASVIEFMKGELGVPYQGYPEPFRTHVLKGKARIDVRPGELLEPFDFDALKKSLYDKYGEENIRDVDIISSALYPAVFDGYMAGKEFGPVTDLPTNIFFTGLKPGESFEFSMSDGVQHIVKLISVSDVNSEGIRTMFFDVDGRVRIFNVKDKTALKDTFVARKAEKSNSKHIGSPMPGEVVDVKVKAGQKVNKGDVLLVLSAMKMETSVTATDACVIDEVLVSKKMKVAANDLIITLV